MLRGLTIRRKLLESGLIVLAAFMLSIVGAWAQRSGIQGTVTDESGGVIPGVQVTAKDLETGAVSEAITNDSGFYSFPLLKEARYELTCSMAGFETQRTEIVVEVGSVSAHHFRLRVGAPTNVVEVTSTAARIQQQPHSVGTVIEEKQIHELPLNGRNYLTLAGLAPGILIGAQGGRGEATAGEGGFRSGGLPMDQTAILVDGVDNAARTVQGPLQDQAQTLKPAVEAISEFKVVTNNVSAEYGYKAGAQVLVSTKSGTNQFHGALYEFHRNNSTAANNFMFNRDGPRDPQTNELTEGRPPFIRNQFGGTIGGPIRKDKTFFFFSFQGTRIREAAPSFLQAVPSSLARIGDFSQELDLGKGKSNIFDPLTLTGTGAAAERQPFDGNVIPEGRIDPAALQMINLYPLPNVLGQEFEQANYFHVQRGYNDNEVVDARIDHNFSDRHRIFGRYSFRNEERGTGGALPFPATASTIAFYKGHQVALNYNATLNPTSQNELRGGFTHFPAKRDDDYTENLNQKFGIPGAAIDQFPDLIGPEFNKGVAIFSFRPDNRYVQLGGAIAGGTNTTTLDTFYVADNFVKELASHTLKFGGEYRRWTSQRLQGNVFGQFLFDGRYTAQFPNNAASRNATGNSLADAMLGLPFRALNSFPVGEDIASPYWGLYIQDDWRITSRLTLNMGFRWELFAQPRYESFNELTPVSKAVITGDLRDETLDVLPAAFDHWAFPDGTGDCGCKLDKTNFAPRVGIAYRIADNTVIRVGAGLYYSENGAVQQQTIRFPVQGPNTVSTRTDGDFETTPVTVSGGFPPLDPTPGDPTLLTAGFIQKVPDFVPTTSSAQWFLDIQHQLPWNVLITLGYNGQAQSNLPWWFRNVAAPLSPGITAWPTRVRTAGFSTGPVSTIAMHENILNANYNAFTAKAEKRFSEGLSFLGSFTWSRSLDYGSASSLSEHGESFEPGIGGQAPSQYLKDIRMNYGPSGLNRNLAFNLSLLYELPAGPGKGRFESGPGSWILGGWQLGTILSMQSGPWATHNYNSANQANTYGAYRGDLVGEVNLPESQRDSLRWFNDAAFAVGPPAQHGNAGRGLIEAPGWKNLDLLLSKNFAMPWEGHRIQFRFEAFNLTNTPHLAAPSTFTSTLDFTIIPIGNPNATRIIAADDPRIIQFALKYLF